MNTTCTIKTKKSWKSSKPGKGQKLSRIYKIKYRNINKKMVFSEKRSTNYENWLMSDFTQ